MRINSGWCSSPLSHQISGQLNIRQMRWRESFRLLPRQNIRRAPFVVLLIFCVERKQCVRPPTTVRPQPRLEIRALIWPFSSSWLSPLSLFAFPPWHSPLYWEGEQPSISNLKRHGCPIRGLFTLFALIIQHWGPLHYQPAPRVSQRVNHTLKQLRLQGCKATDIPPAVHVHYIWRYRKEEPLEGSPQPNMLIKTWGKCIVRLKGVTILHFI